MKMVMDNGKIRPVQPVEATNLQLGTGLPDVGNWGRGCVCRGIRNKLQN